MAQTKPKTRRMVFVLGDQLDHQSAAFEDFDAAKDMVFMAEVIGESEYVWSTKTRTVFFLSAMRHFRESLSARGWTVDYLELDSTDNSGSLKDAFAQAVTRWEPSEVVVVQPGEYRIQEWLLAFADSWAGDFRMVEDTHFLCTPAQFREHAEGRKSLRMEYFYREMRKRHDVLMEGKKPVGGDWNYDAENRKSFGKSGPGKLPAPIRFRNDATTDAVIELVNHRLAKHPGTCERLIWPVTREEALRTLERFIEERLPFFGDYQDAMWTEEPFLYHSLISAALNVKLLNPREVIAKAEAAYHGGAAPLPAVEGFIRQVLGWREYVRGIYWLKMPDYLELNELGATRDLPAFYWDGQTDMECLRQSISQTLEHGYAHHIQRLMVTGLFALLYGVRPQFVHEWYLAVYADAVEWVELPNTLGMSQYGDGGIMASKPYAASGKYIQRMSNYCQNCPYNPAEATADDACPFTTLYWDFLIRNEDALSKIQRMRMQLRNLERLDDKRRESIHIRAEKVVQRLSQQGFSDSLKK